MTKGRSLDRRKAVSAIAMALLVVSVSFSCMVGVEGRVSGKDGANQLEGSSGTATAPDGSVESYNSLIEPTISSLDDIVPQSYMTKEPYGICYWTPYGVYIFNKSRPEKMSLTSLNGTRLVTESFFTVMAEGMSFEIFDGKVISAVDECLEVSYSLSDASSKTAWSMTVVYDFEDGKKPKITASVVTPESRVKDWNIAWVIVPGEDATVDEADARWAGASLKDIVGKRSSDLDLNISLNVGSEKLTVDWSDAGEGALSITGYDKQSEKDAENERQSLIVSFQKGEEVIDPTVVGETTNAEATAFSCQRKLFWYDGLYWLFYNSGTAIYYRYSADGLAWSDGVRLPDGTTPHSESGFDVAFRNGNVMVGWIDSSLTVYAIKGTVIGATIQWAGRAEIAQNTLPEYVQSDPVSVAIGFDGSYWIAYSYNARFISGPSVTFLKALVSPSCEQGSFERSYSWSSYSPVICRWNSILMPLADGGMAILETGYRSSDSSNTYARVSYLFSGTTSWSGPYNYNIEISSGLSPFYKSTQFSAVASPDGTVHIAYVGTNGHIRYACISLDGTVSFHDIRNGGVSPTICLDSNDVLHISSLDAGPYGADLYHFEKPKNTGSWSGGLLRALGGLVAPHGLTSLAGPTTTLALAWTFISMDGSRPICFASLPLPFGTSGYSSNPWDRDGLSPYGTYFAMNGQYVSPGSGQLTVVQQDVSIAGRGGMDLEVSRIYQQPKYFYTSGSAYDYKAFPFCDVGRYWSLDLPWMDDRYVYLANGQRFIIHWGNEGDAKEFVNHDGAHFVLRDVNKQGTLYYELITSAGIRYQFDHSSPFALTKISDLANYDPDATSYTEPYNCLTLTYNGNSLSSITDSALGREISFSYENGKLSSITRPDGGTITYSYGSGNLMSVTDADGRVTTFTYDLSSHYCLSTITYPSGGKVQYTYGLDQTPATEVESRLITSESIRNVHTNDLIRQTSFNYKIVNGKVTYCKLVNYDETGAVQGSNVYIFQSALKSSSEIVLGPAGEQMQKATTWYDANGQPSRVDTYSGSSTEVSYSEYMAYDDWGNVIFTRDALGHDSYYSYANTDTQNSFQGGTILERTSSGKIFHDSFDDWDYSDWVVEDGAGSVQLDGSDTADAPSVKLSRGSTAGDLRVTHPIPVQTSPFYMQVSFKTSSTTGSYILGMAGDNLSVYIIANNNQFLYRERSGTITMTPFASYSVNTWYDVGVYVDPVSHTYDIYLNGVLVKEGAPLLSGGIVDGIRIQAGTTTSTAATNVWFDNVRVYRDKTITVNGLDINHIVELYDSRNNLIDRSKDGTLTLSTDSLAMFAPPAYIKVMKVGDSTYSTPMMDIWGGDVYSLIDGNFIAAVEEYSNGYAQSRSSIADDAWPSGSTAYSFGQGYSWVTDSDYAVTGNKYRQSGYPSPNSLYNHGHGFKSTNAYMHVDHASDAIVQYIWLEDGKIPQEIVLQYFVNNVWKRAYWGGDASGNDVFTTLVPSELRPASQDVHRIGDVPRTTGQWIQLVVKASDLGIVSGSDIYGIVYGLRGGTAKWDCSGVYNLGVKVDGVPSGMTVKMTLENGTTVSKVASSSTVTLDLYSEGIRVFPVSASFEIFSGSTLVYASPVYDEIYNYDKFRYEGTSFYPNEIKSDLHSNPVGTLTYQDDGGTVSQESYISYSRDGYPVASKTRLGPGWIYTESSYDLYGNLLSSTDASGVATHYEYDPSGTYLVVARIVAAGEAVSTNEDFETSGGWTFSKSSMNGNVNWLNGKYSTARSTSPIHSIELGFISGFATHDVGSSTVWKDYDVSEIDEISARMYLSEWSHTGRQGDLLESGIRMRLYDSSGSNYATYTYWLSCWYMAQDSRTPPDGNTKVIYGKPTLNTWLNVELDPSADWSIDWSQCDSVKFELFAYLQGSNADRFTVYYDDLSIECAGSVSSRAMSYTEYDDVNRLVTYTDELGHKTVMKYDELGRLISTGEYHSSSQYYETLMTYDAVGNLKTVRQANGETTRMHYDSLGRQTSILYPDGYSESWTYDNAGKVLTSTSRSGLVTTSSYDLFGYLVSVSSADDTITTSYDLKGRIVERSNGLGSITYQYDEMDRVIEMVETIDGVSFALTYGYDDAGNLLYVDYPDSSRVSYYYDDFDRLADVVSSGQTLLHLTYNLDGSVATETYCGGNSVVSYDYNERGWVSSISAEDRYGTELLGLRYTYDAVGNVLSIRDDVGAAGTENYWYDDLGRITKATGAWGTIQYGYDSVGNRLWKNENGNNDTYAYETYNRLTFGGSWVYVNDADGNVVEKVFINPVISYVYEYNSFGQMTSVTEQGMWGWDILGEYYYDANGARAMVTDSSGTSRFVYSGHDPVYEVSSDDSTNKYVYANGKLAIRIVNRTENDCYVLDALGSTRLVLKNGNVGAQDILFSVITYKPFGAVYDPEGSDQVTFAGEIVDDTGLVYLFARYYDPDLGRFYALDPELGSLSMPQTLNRYVYCANSPLIHTDPTGRFWNIVIGAVAGAVVGGVMAAVTGGDYKAIIAGAASGAIGGAITAATFGLAAGATTLPGALAILATGGAASSAASDVVSNAVQGKENDWDQIANNAAIGAVTNVAFWGMGKGAQSVLGKTVLAPEKIKRAVQETKLLTRADAAILKANPIFKGVNNIEYGGNNPVLKKATAMLNGAEFHKSFSASGIAIGIGRGIERTMTFKGVQAYSGYVDSLIPRSYMS